MLLHDLEINLSKCETTLGVIRYVHNNIKPCMGPQSQIISLEVYLPLISTGRWGEGSTIKFSWDSVVGSFLRLKLVYL